VSYDRVTVSHSSLLIAVYLPEDNAAMHPELIKAHLRIGGTTPTALADKLGVAPITVSLVIQGKGTSRRIAEAIANALGQPLADVFPKQYGAEKKPSGLRRTAAQRAA
jgi:putative transcriptional regulator